MRESAWDNVRGFVRAVDRRTFEPTDEASVRERFFGDAFPAGEAGEIVRTSIDEILEGEWESADERLTAEFAEKSICARERPAYEVDREYDDGRHFSACHLHREDVTGERE